MKRELSAEDKKIAAAAKKAEDDKTKAAKQALDKKFADATAHLTVMESLHKKDYDSQIAYINKVLAMEGWSHAQRVKLKEDLARVEGEKTREAEAAAAKLAAKQKAAAEKRLTIETQMHDEIVRIIHGENGAKEASLQKEVEAARKAGVSEVQIAEYVAAKRKELMEEAAKKARSLMAEMQEEILTQTQGEIAGQLRKIAEKIRELRDEEKGMSPDDKAKAESTITAYGAAEKQKLLNENKEMLGEAAKAQEKAADHAERGANAMERTRDAARELGGANSPLQSLAQMASGMNILGAGLDLSAGLGGPTTTTATGKKQTSTADKITAGISDALAGVFKTGTSTGATANGPFDFSKATWDASGNRIYQPSLASDLGKKVLSGSPASTREGAAASLAASTSATAAASGGGTSGAARGPLVNSISITINGKTVSGDVKDPEKLKRSMDYLIGAVGLEASLQTNFEGTV